MDNLKIESPIIEKLYKDININKEAALKNFWYDVEKNGAPIIEKIDDDEENCLVTLVWRETQPVDNIRVIGEIFGTDPDFTKFYRLEGTDLLYRTWKAPKNAHCFYIFVIDGEDEQDWDEFTFAADPLNPHKYTCVDYDKDPEPYLICKEESYVALPDYKVNEWTIEDVAAPKGKVQVFEDFKSNVLNNTRRIWMYTPAGYDKNSEPCPLTIFTDGWHYVHVTKIITVLDNLIAKGEIPPTCVSFIETVNNREEELTCCDKFSEFLTEEVLPWIYENYNVTHDREKTVIAGFSYGGLNAAFIGLKHSEIFSKVFCQSASLFYETKNGKLIECYKNTDKLPLDFFMSFGEYEKEAEEHYGSTKEFVSILESKGYTYKYEEFLGAHHYDDLNMELANGFKYLLGHRNI